MMEKVNLKKLKKIKKSFRIFLEGMKEGRSKGLIVTLLSLKFVKDQGLGLTSKQWMVGQDHTLDGLMAYWKGKALSADEFWGDYQISEDSLGDIQLFLDQENYFGSMSSSILGEIYQFLISKIEKKEGGVYYTPYELCDFLASETIGDAKPKSILDPSCGSGALLCAAYSYIKKTYGHCKDVEFCGWDIDPWGVAMTKVVIAFQEKDYWYPKKIVEQSALIDHQDKFPLILSNPPYLGHKQMDKKAKVALKERYGEIYQDKGDLSFCFVAEIIKILAVDGQAGIILPRYFLEAKNGVGIRKFLATENKLKRIVDFNGRRPFVGVGVDIALVFLDGKANVQREILVQKFDVTHTAKAQGCHDIEILVKQDKKELNTFVVGRDELGGEPWRLNDRISKNIVKKIENKSNRALQDYGFSFQGVITGCDSCFVVDNQNELFKDSDPSLFHPWLKGKDIDPFYVHPARKRVLILDEDPLSFPEISNHIQTFYPKLSNRRECKKGVVPWFGLQWPRNPKHFKREKIIFPYKAPNNCFALDLDGNYFSADIYGLILHELSNKMMVTLLNSKVYDFYFKTFGKKLGLSLYEYYPNTVMQLRIPDEIEALSCDLVHLYDIIYCALKKNQIRKAQGYKIIVDHILCDFFGFSLEERIKIGIEPIPEWIDYANKFF